MESFRRSGWMILGLFVVLLLGSDQIQGRQGDSSVKPGSPANAQQVKAQSTPVGSKPAANEILQSEKDKDAKALQKSPAAAGEPARPSPTPTTMSPRPAKRLHPKALESEILFPLFFL
jgi:hypothetical protein